MTENPPDTRISPALDPASVDHLLTTGEYATDTASLSPYLGDVRATFAATTQTLGALHDARRALADDATRTPAAVAVEMDRRSDKAGQRLAQRWDTTISTLRRQVAALEADLAAPVAAKGSTAVATEIRSHLASLPSAQRQKLLEAAIQDADETTCSAVLAAPPYLSGLSPEMHGLLREAWHRRSRPEVADRHDLLRRALDLAMERSALLRRELGKIVGAGAGQIANLRARSDRATAALSAIDS
jgi:hypothetical protein